MKRIIFLLWSISQMNPVFSQWYPQNTNIYDQLLSVHFIDPQTGFVGGLSGALMKTTDGGSNWDICYPSVNSLNSIYFPSDDTGYIAGGSGLILKTTDAGENWVSMPDIPNYNFLSVFFTDAMTGFVVGTRYESIILKTMDGGNSWDTCLLLPDFTFTEITFTDPGHGFVVGRGWGTMPYGIILKTADGGASWTDTIIAQNNHPVISISMVSADTGYVTSPGELWRTNNGWESWTAHLSPLYNNSPLFFTSSDIGYGIGSYNFEMNIYKTSDGGLGWEKQYSSIWGYIYDLFFPAPDTGFAVGYNWNTNAGLIIHTTNGGMPVNINDLQHDPGFAMVYPNPIHSSIHIDLPEISFTKTYLTISSTNGRQLIIQSISKPQTEIDISHLPAGIYIVKVWNDKEVMVQKVIRR